MILVIRPADPAVRANAAAADTPSGRVSRAKCARNLRHAMPRGKLYTCARTHTHASPAFFFPPPPVHGVYLTVGRLIEFLNKICVYACKSFEFIFI